MDRSLDEIISERPVCRSLSLSIQFTSPGLTIVLQRGGGNGGGGGRRPDRRAPPPPRAPRRDEGPRDGVRKVRKSIGAIRHPSTVAATPTNPYRCRTLLLLRDPSVLARTRHPSAPAHHSMPLEPCDRPAAADSNKRMRTDSDLRAYRTDATKEATLTGKEVEHIIQALECQLTENQRLGTRPLRRGPIWPSPRWI